MGCDIHAMFQARVDKEWVDIENPYEEDRHYSLFSWLADVRNGGAIEPISPPRGFPDGFVVDDENERAMSDIKHYPPWRREWESIRGGMWLGDHSHSWLTTEEVLSAEAPPPLRPEHSITSWI